MKAFMDQDFLLGSETARTLFHEHAEKMPIIDYHCHLSPAEIARDRRFENITQAWLYGTTTNGGSCAPAAMDEEYITGGLPTGRSSSPSRG